jgi:hypothetical protein
MFKAGRPPPYVQNDLFVLLLASLGKIAIKDKTCQIMYLKMSEQGILPDSLLCPPLVIEKATPLLEFPPHHLRKVFFCPLNDFDYANRPRE